ncbi:adenosine receptor A2a-like [Oculina patagonica]
MCTLHLNRFKHSNPDETSFSRAQLNSNALDHLPTMGNFTELNFTSNRTNDFSNYYGMKEVSLIITIIINIITCPLTVLLNVLVIMAVKRRPRLQSYTNILLACLAATDVLTGLTVQPSFILGKTFELLGLTYEANYTDRGFHTPLIVVISVCSSLLLMLVTCERLIAIKFTMHYSYIVTSRNIKLAVISVWIFSLSCEVFRIVSRILLVPLVLISCVLFISSSYAILYHETLRHQKKIKTQQLPQEEVERFAKESKALKTTVFVVGAVVLCLLPAAFDIFARKVANKLNFEVFKTCAFCPWTRTFVMLNSLLNPFIYCWRQKEMRQFVFRINSQVVHPQANS